jgi:translation initiation factor IF-2
MSSTTVAEFAKELKKSSDELLEQLRNAGVNKTSAQDVMNDQDKQKLLSYLQKSYGTLDGGRKKITLVKKSTSEIKRRDAMGRSRTIQVEVRKKRTSINLDEPIDFQNPEIGVIDNGSKLHLHRIQATAFKAFRSLDFDL